MRSAKFIGLGAAVLLFGLSVANKYKARPDLTAAEWRAVADDFVRHGEYNEAIGAYTRAADLSTDPTAIAEHRQRALSLHVIVHPMSVDRDHPQHEVRKQLHSAAIKAWNDIREQMEDRGFSRCVDIRNDLMSLCQAAQ
ncbi:hypothetical protein [Fimbriiglobus ruber]|uniref:Tetratricopeptide repeat protein n=1 Tax=Fimbriiglobus ruber TaxID=1908690 RepID=A0A225DRT0_9BACT|nr:hypothetical protein [Fimbriiglobus ruber]OWK43803.1 hypothetical protein FRUB_03402 [Fimbriiglobus ruber]